MYQPVIQTSQIGYHPTQDKEAVIEMDIRDNRKETAQIIRIDADGEKVVKNVTPANWGKFLRYNYLKVNFTDVKEPGLYKIKYNTSVSPIFRIDNDVYAWRMATRTGILPSRTDVPHARQRKIPRMARLLPHGRCPDGTGTQSYRRLRPERGPGPSSNRVKWFRSEHRRLARCRRLDLRIESQAGESYILALAYEAFHPNLDVTSIDQINRVTEIHQPDGKNDLLQQVENGALTVVNGYLALGRLYRGIICNDLRQYVLLGDAAAMTDGKIGNEDDRWIFTEDNPGRELSTAAQLAAVSRVLKGFNDTLSVHCLDIARKVYASTGSGNNRALFPKVQAAVELYLTTGEQPYMDFILDNQELIIKQIGRIGWYTARVEKLFAQMKNKKAKAFSAAFRKALTGYEQELNKQVQETPYGVPYRPNIWGAGWDIQRFGFQHYFLTTAYPEIFPKAPVFNALNFHSRMATRLRTRLPSLGCRRTISHCRLRTEPRRLVVHSRWSHFRYGAYPSRLPGTPDVPVPLATD